MYSIKSCNCWSSVVVAATPLNLEWAFMRSSSTPQYRRLDLCAISDTLVPIYHQCPAHRGTSVGAKTRQLMQCHDKCRISGSRQRRGRQADIRALGIGLQAEANDTGTVRQAASSNLEPQECEDRDNSEQTKSRALHSCSFSGMHGIGRGRGQEHSSQYTVYAYMS